MAEQGCLGSGRIPGLRVDLGDTAAVRVRARTGLHRSFVWLAQDTYRAVHAGSAARSDPVARVLHGLPINTTRALGLTIQPTPAVSLNVIVPPTRDFIDVAEYLDYLRAVTAAEVAQEVHDTFPGAVPAAWQVVMRDPGRWLTDLAEVLTMLYPPLSPLLSKGKILVDREIDRLGSASVRGGLDGFLSDLGPEFLYRGNSIHFGAGWPPESASLGQRTLTFAPHFARPHRWAVEGHNSREVSITYATRNRDSIHRTHQRPSNVDPLTQLLGQKRAAILQLTVISVNMSRLAALLDCSPATATYHCNHLVASGLLTRARNGQVVLVQASERGQTLLEYFR